MLRWIACFTVVISLTACERTATIAPADRADDTVAVGAAVAAPSAEPAPTQVAAQPTEAAGACGSQCGEGGKGGECGGSCGCNQIPARAPRSVPATATWTELEVQGMRCGGCAKKIEAAVAGVEGVYDVRADYRSGTVRFAAENDIRERVAPRIAALGYRVQ